MSSIALMDYLLAFDPAALTGGGKPNLRHAADWAVKLTRELLAEFEDIQGIDQRLGEVAETHGFNPHAAMVIRGCYEEWARRAEAVLKRLSRLSQAGIAVERAMDLQDAFAKASFLAHFDAEASARVDDQLRRGDVLTGEEARRELQSRRIA